MAQPTVIAGTKLLILLGDGGSPEVFAAPCGLTTTGFTLSASTNTTLIPDCDDPELPAWEAKDVNALSGQVSGSGVMAVESFDLWNNFFLGAVSKNVQIKLDNAGLGSYKGSFILTSFKLSGQRGQKVTVDITLDNNGAITWTDAS